MTKLQLKLKQGKAARKEKIGKESKNTDVHPLSHAKNLLGIFSPFLVCFLPTFQTSLLNAGFET